MSLRSKIDFDRLAANRDIEAKTYWKEHLAGLEFVEYFKGAPSGAPSSERRDRCFTLQAAESTCTALQALAATSKSRHVVLFSVLGILTEKYSSQDRVCLFTLPYEDIGASAGSPGPVSVRKAVPVIIDHIAQSSFRQLLTSMKERMHLNFTYADYPVEQILNTMTGRIRELHAIGLLMDKMPSASFDHLDPGILFCFSESPSLQLTVRYDAGRFEEKEMEQVSYLYFKLLDDLLADSNRTIREIELIPVAEKLQILTAFNNTEKDFPRHLTLVDLFVKQAKETPDHTALLFGDRTMTYAQLDHLSDRVANYLRQNGRKTGTVIAVEMERSPEMMVTIFGILKAGCVYLPLSRAYPAERIRYMLQDSQAEALISDEPHDDRYTTGIACLHTEELLAGLHTEELLAGPHTVELLAGPAGASRYASPDAIAYIIYTSGSTGRPKGVPIRHRSVVNRLHWMQDRYPLTGNDVLLQKTPLVFDVSVWELFWWALYGAKLLLAPPGAEKDPEKIAAVIRDQQVTVIHFVPAMLNAFLNDLALARRADELYSLRHLFCSGEELSRTDAARLLDLCPGVSLHNLYGPTEATVDVSFYDVTGPLPERRIPIGKPIDNTQLLIFNRHLQLQPIGVAGELFIGGENLSPGYLNQAALTGGKFIQHPFGREGILYRTGDLARWLPDGNIEYLGRIDDQVKIRGYRIELKEIESCLEKIAGVRQSTIVIKGTTVGKTMIAYYVADHALKKKDLVRHLLQDLPDYMVPADYIHLTSMPVTPNGKINRRALPEPDFLSDTPYVSPAGETEERVAEIFAEVLEVEIKTLSADAGFFTIGGDSIRAIRLLGIIQERMSTAISLADIYQYPSICLLAGHLGNEEKPGLPAETTAGIREEIAQLRENILSQLEDPENISDIFPMSDIEKGMIYHSLARTEDALYHDQFFYNVRYSRFDLGKVKKALDLMVEKHAILRTGFSLDDYKIPLHIVRKEIIHDLQYHDLSSMDRDGQEEVLKNVMAADKQAAFDFRQAPLWRIKIYKTGPRDYCLLLVFHHAILDGWSVASLMTELNNTYLRLLEDVEFRPVMSPLSYKDYVIGELAANKDEASVNYWRREMKDALKMDLKDNLTEESLRNEAEEVYPTPEAAQGQGIAVIRKEFAPELYDMLQTSARRYSTGMQEICFSAYLYAINMLANSEELLVGLVANNRPSRKQGDELLGCFLTTVPFKLVFPHQMTGYDLIRQVHEKLLEVRKYQHVSLHQILNLIGKSGLNENPLFDTIFNYIDFHVYEKMKSETTDDYPGLSYNLTLEGYVSTNTDLDVSVGTFKGLVSIKIAYSRLKFTRPFMEKFLLYFERIFSTLIRSPRKILDSGEIMTGMEKDRILLEFNSNVKEYPLHETVIGLFERQVEKKPESIALSLEGEELTYRALNRRADELAHTLINDGYRQGDLIALITDRSMEMIVGILGILKSGAAYLPLDPFQPEERIRSILSSSQAAAVVTTASFADRYKERQRLFIIPPAVKPAEGISDADTGLTAGTNVFSSGQSNSNSEGLAYVIYTSGSTGEPKGVMIGHRSLTNMVCSMASKYGIDEKDRVLQFSPFYFDASVEQIFIALTSGATLILVKKQCILDRQRFTEYIQDYQVTHLNTTPSFLREMDIQVFPRLRRIIVGGEACDIRLAEKFYRDVKFYNAYGPTEVTVTSAIHQVTERDIKRGIIPIGRPVDNNLAYILNRSRQIVPVGVVGELYFGGEGLAKGYCRDEQHTREKFITDPIKHSGLVYKTGDLARWCPDGEIEYVNRADNQVKIRGFRVELDEINKTLAGYAGISRSVVVVQGEAEKFIVAYYAAHAEIDSKELVSYLSRKLPDYMVPVFYRFMEQFPLTTNDKIDHKALPAVDLYGQETFQPAAGDVERKLCSVWSELLDLDAKKIGVNRSFFELGGHSLKAVTLVNRIYKDLDVRISLREVFRLQNIRDMAVYISSQKETGFREIPKARLSETYPLSSAQRRLFFIHEFDSTSLAYNLPQVIKLQGIADISRLAGTFNRLIHRHGSLRTSFKLADGSPVQQVADHLEFTLEYYSSVPGEVNTIVKKFIRPFRLSGTPLIRAGLIQTGTHEHYMIIDMHHIITDGVSSEILIRDFMSLYQNEALPELKIQYTDYAAWQSGRDRQEETDRQKEFWLKEFSTIPSPLELPFDFRRPFIKEEAGGTLRFSFDEETVDKMQTLAAETGATLFMVTLSAFYILLHKLSGQQDVVIGIPVAGRHHPDLQDIIGLFVNTLAVRSQVLNEKGYLEFLSAVKNSILACLENQEYAYELLIDELKIKRETGRNPLFDVLFAYNNYRETKFELPGLAVSGHPYVNQTSKFDLSLSCVEDGNQLHFAIEYATGLFKEESIERFIAYFRNITAAIVGMPHLPISEIRIIDEGEKAELLSLFNNTAADYPSAMTLVDLFEQQVMKTPDHIALRYEQGTVSYHGLGKHAARIASYLRYEQDVQEGDLVGVMLERDESLIPAIFGILKAGAAYVPIDPSYPAARTLAIIKDSGMKALITKNTLLQTWPGICRIVADWDAIDAHEPREVPAAITGKDLAYVIYTSGSTGKPKGVMIEHHSVINRLLWMQKQYPLTPADVLLQKTPIVFDVSVWELFWWSFSGASLRILPPGSEKDPAEMIRIIKKNEITTLHFVPSMLAAFLSCLTSQSEYAHLKSLRRVFCSGEALKPWHVRDFGRSLYHNCGTRLINLYGPTEATVDVSFYECRPDLDYESVPIGKPIDNIQLYILGQNNDLLPVGVPGELCISGVGLARGYLNNESLTSAKFAASPFRRGARIYRTGDRAKWLADGTILFLDRIDKQVKIRGYRIEPEEIESQLIGFGSIREAVVVKREKNDQAYLFLYYVSDTELDPSAIKAHLASKLPEYMIPYGFVRLSGMPLTINGKLDSKALPEAELPVTAQYAAPCNEIEEKLSLLWAVLLHLDVQSIGVTHSFFELGGNSLLMISLRNRILESFQVDIPVREIFLAPTIRRLAETINVEYWIASSGNENQEAGKEVVI